MDPIVAKISGKDRYELRFDLREFNNDPVYAPLDRFRREIIHVDYTDPIQIDMARLMTCFRGVRSRDFQYYFFMLNLLKRNDEAIHCPHKEMKMLFKDNLIHTVSQAVDRLVKQGLILRPPDTRGKYIINPVYAWKGNRLDYLDLGSFQDKTREYK